MEAVLQQLNSVPGVFGSMICGPEGALAAHTFPAVYDRSQLEEAASAVAESSAGLRGTGNSCELLDFRYGEGRLFVRPIGEAFLLLLCSRGINLQLLTISLNVAARKLERLVGRETLPATDSSPLSPPATAPPAAVNTPAPLAPAGARSVPLVVEILKSNAGTYWEQMVNVVALNRRTSIQISDHFQTGAFRKLTLTNPVTGAGKCFPVRIMTDDAEQRFQGRVVISRTTAEVLGVHGGDAIEAAIVIGGGIFGWEGI